MTNLQLLLTVLISIIGIFPDELLKRITFKSGIKGYWLKLIPIGIVTISIIGITMIDRNRKAISVRNEVEAEKSINLITKISTKLSEENIDFSTYESMIKIIKSTESIISMTEKDTEEYYEKLNDLKDSKEKLQYVQSKIENKECYLQIQRLLNDFFKINNTQEKDIIINKYNEFHNLLVKGYNKNYLKTSPMVIEIYHMLYDVHSKNF